MRTLLIALMLSAGAATMLAADRVLVVTATAGYRHESIETAERVLAEMSRRKPAFDVSFARDESDMARLITAEELRAVKVVMFVNSTGELALPNRDVLIQWVARGGSVIGVHSASDTWHEWPAWVEMLGGEFLEHPPEFLADVVVENQNHPATEGLSSVLLFEEIYSFKSFDRSRVNVLLSLRGAQPLAWYRSHGAGRVFYTALGHRADVWELEWFQKHVAGAIRWGLRQDVTKKPRAVRRSE